jgi:PhzF family phenazine biosynthesis protein
VRIPIFKINVFTSDYRGGNPAGVCPLETWLPDALMQSIAKENGYSDTAFFVPSGENYDLRWFMPGCEVDLCGHATLATAFALRFYLGQVKDSYKFNTRSGLLSVEPKGEILVLDMPALEFVPAIAAASLVEGLGVNPKEVYKGQDYMVVLSSAEEVAALRPNYKVLRQIDSRGFIVTARGSDGIDFVSRWFGGPDVGIDEDPVTGSAHCMLVPYWSQVLAKRQLTARQISERGGDLHCELVVDRVKVGGQAVLYLSGEIQV